MTTKTIPARALPISGGATAARGYLLVSGLFLVLTGVVGFALDTSFPTSSAEVADSHGHIFGILETNGWHNLAALSIGLPAVAVAFRLPQVCAVFALIAGVLNLGVFASFSLWSPDSFLFASNAGDQVLHALLAIGGIGFGALGLTANARTSTSAQRAALRNT